MITLWTWCYVYHSSNGTLQSLEHLSASMKNPGRGFLCTNLAFGRERREKGGEGRERERERERERRREMERYL
jgi:hypothetical protein